jgi:hypothetical protein
MGAFSAARYGPCIAEILAEAGGGVRLMPLVSGPCVSEEARRTLHHASAADLFAGCTVAREDFAAAVRSGLFLYLSCPEESHSISQDIASATGSFWHGILHRQEPDYANARYWFRRVGAHPIFPELQQAASVLASGRLEEVARDVRLRTAWDPFWLIEACERIRRRPDPGSEGFLQEVQRAEWQLLFDYSYRQAVGIK